MQANGESHEQGCDDSLLPISPESWEARGGTAWLVAGVCALALAVFVSIKLEPAAARARTEAGYEEQPVTRREPAHAVRETPAPAAADAPVESRTDAEPVAPPVNSETQTELASEQSPVTTTEPAAAIAPSASVQKPKVARHSRHASEELQRLRHEFTVAANLGTAVAQEPMQQPDGPAPQALAAPVEVPEPSAAPAPAPAVAAASEQKPAIPDNPY